jgi:ankyrin repeat protein
VSCLPAALTSEQVAQLADLVVVPEGGQRAEACDALAVEYGFSDWSGLVGEVRRRETLTSCDVARVEAMLEAEPERALEPMVHWCDHGCVAPLNFIAMLRFDAGRLGLTHDLSATGTVAHALIAAGAPPNGEEGDVETPLMTAASYGDADVARVLVEAGADLDALAAPTSGGVPGGSALLHAAVFGMTEVLDLVVAHGARVRGIVEAAAAGDISGWPLAEATEQERVLALIMAADHERLGVIDELLAVGTPVDAVDETWHRQALRVAAENGRVASVRRLLARGADPNTRDAGGRTALDLTRDDTVAAILRPITGPAQD